MSKPERRCQGPAVPRPGQVQGGADQGQVGAQRLYTDTRTCSDGSPCSAPYSWAAWGGG